MPKAEISWKRVTEDGEKIQVYAQRVGREWKFSHRAKRFDQWQPVAEPPLEDWLELLDAVQRLITRRRLPAGRRGARAPADSRAFSRRGNLNLISRKNFIGSSAHGRIHAQRHFSNAVPVAGRRIKNFSSRRDSSSIFAGNCTPTKKIQTNGG